MAAAAGPGRIVSADASGLDPSLERRTLALKGKEQSTQVVSMRVSP